jgi:hypothetical protein
MRRGLAACAALSGLLAVCPASHAVASPSRFAGSCQFAGPISPGRPITLVPVLGSRFSYLGSGVCSGTLDGDEVQSAPINVMFTDVSTLFDTCELGPDFELHGTAMIASGPIVDSYEIVVNLARLALVGPFVVSTTGGGLGLGLAQFAPPETSTAVQQCVAPGLSTASLAASFSTLAPLIGDRGGR